MSEGQGTAKPFDPFEPFREVRDVYLDAMAKAMIEAVNTEGYAQATGAMLDGYLTASAPFRQALETSMVHALEQLSLPSRQELASLAERFTNLEMRLDDMDAKLDRMARGFPVAQQENGPAQSKTAKATGAPEPRGGTAAAGPSTAKRAATAKPNPARKRSTRKGQR